MKSGVFVVDWLEGHEKRKKKKKKKRKEKTGKYSKLIIN